MSPVQKVKETVTERINSGEINIGEEVVRSSYTSYTTNKENEVERKEKDVFARKISMLHIRKRLLEKHERTPCQW